MGVREPAPAGMVKVMMVDDRGFDGLYRQQRFKVEIISLEDLEKLRAEWNDPEGEERGHGLVPRVEMTNPRDMQQYTFPLKDIDRALAEGYYFEGAAFARLEATEKKA